MKRRQLTSDRCVPLTMSVPLSTFRRLERLIRVQHLDTTENLHARNMILQALDRAEAALGLGPLAPLPSEAPTPYVPGSAQDHAREALPAAPLTPPPGDPSLAPGAPVPAFPGDPVLDNSLDALFGGPEGLAAALAGQGTALPTTLDMSRYGFPTRG